MPDLEALGSVIFRSIASEDVRLTPSNRRQLDQTLPIRRKAAEIAGPGTRKVAESLGFSGV
jgi:hypothetical protein